ncbi:MAG: hypothetical protein AAFP03_08465, partial [Cyanobacteria bacterium J06598_3]
IGKVGFGLATDVVDRDGRTDRGFLSSYRQKPSPKMKSHRCRVVLLALGKPRSVRPSRSTTSVAKPKPTLPIVRRPLRIATLLLTLS